MTKSQLSLQLYNSAQEFLDDNLSELSLHEVQNIFLLISTQSAAKEGSPFYGNAVWDMEKSQLILALVWFNNSELYASHVPESHCKEAMNLALSDLASKQPAIRTQLSIMHAFQPALGYLESCYSSVTDVPILAMERVWSQTMYRQTPSLKLPHVPTACKFKLATEDLVDTFIIPWLQAFLKEVELDQNLYPATELVQQSMKDKFIYVVYDQEGVPVSMAWKRRPTLYGCSIAFVYTPPAYRGCHYASLCVGLLSEMLLKDFDYVTLFVLHTRDPYKNLYSELGYQLTGEAARILFSANQNTA
ncbi:hypothetical protein A0J61_09874 [Choanephora cucurbitarum]|uniref:N-acetyltransferase domain-containing protein n=1 Tax=Choanephora cucurbitarum TaxID=101091 RepID=A0A1C7MZ23_9FUNG|nr:hypothetical protein A0J61_09874 [Choanephora cucurbitarum]